MQYPQSPEEDIRSPEFNLEVPDVGSRNRIQIFCKDSVCRCWILGRVLYVQTGLRQVSRIEPGLLPGQSHLSYITVQPGRVPEKYEYGLDS